MNEHKPDWFAKHEEEDRKAFAARPTTEEMRTIIDEALRDFFKAKGRLTYSFVVAAGAVVLALGALAGGIKWLLGLFGYMLTRQ